MKVPHITFLVDRSGSMASIRSDVIGGFNSFLKDQQNGDGECRLTVHQFDTNGFDTLFEGLDIDKVRDATEADFQPRGGTPLFDAIGRAITAAQVRLESEAGSNEQPVIVILTDGQENSSHEYTRERIFSLITEKERQGWVFTYLGANQDSYAQGASIGIHFASTQNFVPDARGTRTTMDSLSAAVTSHRTRNVAGQTVTSANYYAEVGKAADEDWKNRTQAKTSDTWEK